MLRINKTIIINELEIEERFVHSSGPGGQNVNKVNSGVLLKFEASKSSTLNPKAKIRLKFIAGQKWSKEGVIIIHCDSTRSQARIPTKPTLAGKKKRLSAKKRRGEVKLNRSRTKKESCQFY